MFRVNQSMSPYYGQIAKIKDGEKIPGRPANSRHAKTTMQLVYLFLRFVNVRLRNRELEVWPQVTAYILRCMSLSLASNK